MPNYNTQGITSSAGGDPRNLGGSEGYGNPTASTSSGLMSSTANATTNNDDNDDEPGFFESIANLFSGAGADLPSDKSDDDGDSGISFYDSPMFAPYDGGSDNDTAAPSGLPFETTAADRALYEALGVDLPEVYKGKMGEEEPEPNLDMDVLQSALQPEPITVEEIEVKAGDTLTAIAEEKGVPVQAVIDANPQIKNPDLIRPGEKVTLPGMISDMGKLLKTATDPEAPAPVSEDPDREFYQSGVPIEERVFEGAETGEGLMSPRFDTKGETPEGETPEGAIRPKARPTGLSSLNTEEKNKAAQEYLGVTVDGVWGRGSTRKLAGWQYQNGLPVSGELDEATIKAMENPETEDPRKEKTRKSVLNAAGTAPDISKVKTWAKENIKDPIRAAAFVATVEAETGGRALVEGGHTLKSAVRTFVTNNKSMHEGNDLNRPLTAKGKRRKQKLEALGSNATGDEIFDFIYGPDTDAIGATLGNTSATDGSKYKGRGLVQITGKDNYQRIGDIIGVDLVNNPELVKDPKYAAAAAMAYLTLPGKDFFDGTLTSDKLARAIGHTGSAADRWTRTTALKNEMYP
jgi:LysM repeat protein